MLTISERKLRLTGRGAAEDLAFQDVLQQVKAAVLAEYPGVILQIEPLELTVVSAEVCWRTERFLGLFWPRRHKTLQVVVDITVRLRGVDTRGIVYNETEERLSPLQHVLKMR